MLCQNCQSRIANVHFSQTINNNKVEMYLCEQCAREQGQIGFGEPFGISDFITGLMGAGKSSTYVKSLPKQLSCDKCGMSYEEFQKQGKMGCGNCYEVFNDRMEPLLRRLHGNTEHTGKIPGNASVKMKTSKEIEQLKTLIEKAVQSEEYEKAAELRDRIRSLEVGK